MKESVWKTLQHTSSQVMALEKIRMGAELRIWQYKQRFGETAELHVAPLVSSLEEIKASERKLKKECANIASGSPEAQWFDEVTGFGSAVWYVLGGLPVQPGEFSSVSGLWKYCGLHVHNGGAVKRRQGDEGDHQRFKQELRAWVLYRVGKPHMNMKGGTDKNGNPLPRSPYRDEYDQRREHTMETHPPMMDDDDNLRHPDCEHCQEAVDWTEKHREESHQQRERTTVGKDCSNMGGVHWTTGHRHADALRVMTKAILRDIYRIWNGQHAKFSGDRGQRRDDTHRTVASVATA